MGLFSRKKKQKDAMSGYGMDPIRAQMLQELRKQTVGHHARWLRGPKAGTTQLITDLRSIDGSDCFVFDDGTHVLTVQIENHFTLADRNESTLPTGPVSMGGMMSMDPTLKAQIQQPELAVPTAGTPTHVVDPESGDVTLVPRMGEQAIQTRQVSVAVAAVRSSLADLLSRQKKKRSDVGLVLTLDLPAPATLRVLSESFDDFDEELGNWLRNDQAFMDAVVDGVKAWLIGPPPDNQ